MYTPYVRISSGNVQTTLDTSARNTLGAIYSPPPSSTAVFSTTATSSTAGYAAQPVFKYVYYNSTTNPAPVAAPAPVYYTDESFTQVSGNAAEAYFTTVGACVAGYLMPNTTAYSGLTATILNQSYCWIQIGGLLQGAYGTFASGTPGQGNVIYGATTGNWAQIVNNASTASAANVSRVLAVQWTAVANSLCDVLVNGDSTFWGS